MDSRWRERFAAEWAALWSDAGPVGLAVSGGPDSLGLLLLAEAELAGRFLVATVDHGLRRESADEAAFVRMLCDERKIPHSTLTLELTPGPALQERARLARYSALGLWANAQGLSAIVTAHHADDQAETVLMRLSRGAGVRGLSAMRARAPVPGHPDLVLLRPLLGWRASELAAIVAAAGISAVKDPSNSDTRYERVRARASLTGMADLDALAVAASARHLAEADEVIDWAAKRSFASAEYRANSLLWAPHDEPRAVVLRVLELLLSELGASQPRGTALSRWCDDLVAGGIATLGGVRGDARKRPWRFSVAAPHRKRVSASHIGS